MSSFGWSAPDVRGVGETSGASGPIRRARRRRRITSASNIGSSEHDLPQYKDSGDAMYVCDDCQAEFWFDERVERHSRINHPVYTHCCKLGSVALPQPLYPPPYLDNLYEDRHFIENIRAYNSVFSMTSFGAKTDDSVNDGRGPYTFKISGQVSHWIGSLCPQSPERPRFLQLYVYDTENKIQNRLSLFERDGIVSLKPEVISCLTQIPSTCNEFVRTFKNATEIAARHSVDDFCVRLYNNVSDPRYGRPSPGSLGAIVTADDPNASQYDIIVRSRYGPPHRVNKLHHSYMPLQYPLLFPYGEKGWSKRLKLRGRGVRGERSLTVNMYYSFIFHDRPGVHSFLLRSGRLFQQFIVDSYLCVEDSRIEYVRRYQNLLRSEYVSGVYDAISRGDSEGNQIGMRIFLPATFVGGPRYMYKHYQDALAICRVYGNPQYFITFTCNVRWPEIVRYMDSHEMGHSQNRPDIIARIFQLKVSDFIAFLKEDKTFGIVTAYLYTIEFQKRGLPHCHTLLWVDSDSLIRSPADVDKHISAELPDPLADPSLYTTVTGCMLHGPCGLSNLTASCMSDGRCQKGFPKPFNSKTFFDKDGYVHYKRDSVAFHTLRSGVQVHNGFVVPYNRRLCSRFDAHINVEYCGWSMMIKYLFKYISKGVERVSFAIRRNANEGGGVTEPVPEQVNEITNFLNGRYICPHEAAWRILNFPIHERQPAVQILAVHLENMQSATFTDNTDLESMIRRPTFGRMTLNRWLTNNRWDPDGRHLKYTEYTSLYRWDAAAKEWIYRTRNTTPSVGRLVYIHPTSGELFYLRMLLCYRTGCRSFTDVRTVNGVVFPSYRLACEALGLIGDDREWLTAFDEAAVWASSSQLRLLFSHLLLFCEVTDTGLLWGHARPKLGDDIRRTLHEASSSSTVCVDESLVEQHILLQLENLLNAATPSKSLKDFSLPMPSRSVLASLGNRLVLEERSYDTWLLEQEHAEMASHLNPEQLLVYNRIKQDQASGVQTLLFVYGHGGTGKTFLWTTILAYFRSIGKIVLAVAAFGIASLLLPAGRTAHSRFKIPVDLSDTSMCKIKKNTHLSELLAQASMVIWDEVTMSDRKCFECVDRSFRDILGKKDTLFGGMSMLLGGDFRQTLPVKRKKTNMEIMASTLPNSYLWLHFTLYKLTHNMRLFSTTSTHNDDRERAFFASWLLDIGNGNTGTPDPNNPETSSIVDIPENLLITNEVNSLHHLIDFVYGSNVLLDPTPSNLCSRAIVCPKNDTADKINTTVLAIAPGTSKTYLSTDSIIPHTHRMSDLDILYPEEYLNQMTFTGLPLHKLTLKKTPPFSY